MEPIKPINNQYTTENPSMGTNTVYIISIGFLTTALILCIVVSIAVITAILKKE